MRKKLIAGNWKMNFTPMAAEKFVNSVKFDFESIKVDVVLCVPFVSIAYVQDALMDTTIQVGAQNMHFEHAGAFTGEISGEMLKEMGVPYVIIGHSERRQYFNETDATVNLKTKQALALNIAPIVCIGESLEEREADTWSDVLLKQTKAALAGIDKSSLSKIVIAYEPIWAIGTGKTATSDQAEAACAYIRGVIGQAYDTAAADKVRILYGGSVSPTNAAELFNKPNIDGGLVGGASMLPSFEDIIHYE